MPSSMRYRGTAAYLSACMCRTCGSFALWLLAIPLTGTTASLMGYIGLGEAEALQMIDGSSC